MKIKIYIPVALLALSSLVSGCVVDVVEEPVSKTSTQSAAGFSSLEMTNSDSYDINVQGVQQDTINAIAKLSIWAKSEEKAKQIANSLSFGWNNANSVARLKVDYTNPDLELAKLTGISVDAPSRMGLNIETSSGDINVSNMKGDLTLKTSSGDINATTTGRVALDASSGDIAVSTGLGGTVTSSSGDVDMNVTSNNFEGVNIDASSGDITVAIADGAPISFDLESSSGSIYVDYGNVSTTTSEYLTINVNGGGKVVHLSASSGDIHVKRFH